jgi:hypothetical protein
MIHVPFILLTKFRNIFLWWLATIEVADDFSVAFAIINMTQTQ